MAVLAGDGLFTHLRTSHPGKFIWTLLAILLNVGRFPFWLLYFAIPSLRHNPQWTLKQAVGVRIVRAFLQNVWQVRMYTPTSLKPGSEGKQFVVMSPATSSSYSGIVKRDPEIVPEKVGGTWYPVPLLAASGKEEVVIHFHGGAYAIGDGRKKDAGFAAKTILANTPASHVLCPQYRLCSNPGGRFPAALQDAITAYKYVTETLGISSDRVTLSGDSAGAHLILGLLRYIEDQPEAKLPKPICAWAWSPWVDPGSVHGGDMRDSPHYMTDYITPGFPAWGSAMYAPSKASGVTFADPHIDMKGNHFLTPTPILFIAGSSEVLWHDIMVSYEGFKAIEGNKVALEVQTNACHDIILIGDKTGFEAEAARSAKVAGKFLEAAK